MGIELINLSNETKAHLNNLTRAIERLARQGKPRFVEFPTSNGQLYVRADRVDCIQNECDGVYLTIGGDGGYKVKSTYGEAVAKVNEALGVTGAAISDGGAE